MAAPAPAPHPYHTISVPGKQVLGVFFHVEPVWGQESEFWVDGPSLALQPVALWGLSPNPLIRKLIWQGASAICRVVGGILSATPFGAGEVLRWSLPQEGLDKYVLLM